MIKATRFRFPPCPAGCGFFPLRTAGPLSETHGEQGATPLSETPHGEVWDDTLSPSNNVKNPKRCPAAAAQNAREKPSPAPRKTRAPSAGPPKTECPGYSHSTEPMGHCARPGGAPPRPKAMAKEQRPINPAPPQKTGHGSGGSPGKTAWAKTAKLQTKNKK